MGSTAGTSSVDLSAAKALVLASWGIHPEPGHRGVLFGVDWRAVLADDAPFARFMEAWVSAPFGPQPTRAGLLLGAARLRARVLAPIAASFPDAALDLHLFFAGEDRGQVWVACTGYITGGFQRDLYGVPATRHHGRLRFGAFYLVDCAPNSQTLEVQEVRWLFDMAGLAAQAGIDVTAPFSGRHSLPPGPALANGLCFAPQDPVQSAETLALTQGMIGGANRLDARGLSSMGMAAYWHKDMKWYGPWGVGWTDGFDEFEADAQGPSVASFPDRRGGPKRAWIAEGMAAGFCGWPSLRGTFDGAPFRGFAPTGEVIGMTLMDFYIRRGDKLAENWVIIDLIDFAGQCGVDWMAQIARRADALALLPVD